MAMPWLSKVSPDWEPLAQPDLKTFLQLPDSLTDINEATNSAAVEKVCRAVGRGFVDGMATWFLVLGFFKFASEPTCLSLQILIF